MVSSGATSPAREPASTDMLHRVIRPSIDRALTASPRYSITWPCPPAVPIREIRARQTSFAVTPGGSAPSTVTAMSLSRRISSVWVASTCSTCAVPMPNATAPKAPSVVVCESQQTMVIPGRTMPSSGPMTCTMPWSSSPRRCSLIPNSSQFCRIRVVCRRPAGSWITLSIATVGVLWSSVPTVRSGRRTVRPAARRASKANGVFTSCSNCRST